jgi:hypothetical protein
VLQVQVVMTRNSVMQKSFQARSCSVHQNKNIANKTLDRCCEAETAGWLDRNTHEVLACLLEDVQEYKLPDAFVDESLVCVSPWCRRPKQFC